MSLEFAISSNILLHVTNKKYNYIISSSLQVMQFLQLSGNRNRKLFEQTTLTLELLEALLVPQLLWIVSRRYRHALVYLWRTSVLRQPGEDEDGNTSIYELFCYLTL